MKIIKIEGFFWIVQLSVVAFRFYQSFAALSLSDMNRLKATFGSCILFVPDSISGLMRLPCPDSRSQIQNLHDGFARLTLQSKLQWRYASLYLARGSPCLTRPISENWPRQWSKLWQLRWVSPGSGKNSFCKVIFMRSRDSRWWGFCVRTCKNSAGCLGILPASRQWQSESVTDLTMLAEID